MMLPIAQAVLQQLKSTESEADDRDFQESGQENHGFELDSVQTKQDLTDGKQPDTKTQQEQRDRKYNCFTYSFRVKIFQ